ncbi:DUF2071 domain-containing protein [Saccharopolyspora phatthalungensis]|uniref:DUF2071 domain-containing protein n=1 Tax=Saccharopolyspora phatthalungensis TaxID=664693 RepID=A0A840QKB8_9PSEU|nr:DUF2071 domain-containing protein [Saccharopolyspora phatthalungensis]MBB5159765.1 hypothetical protein [Saccharopolyspora phatthalungensis]
MEPEPITLTAPHRVRWAFTRQRWSDVVFVHWPCQKREIEPLLPPRTRPDLFAGTSWLGVVGLRMSVTGPVRLRFTELNVRTFVVDERGRRGLAFLTMEASSPVFVRIASTVGCLPYRSSAVGCATTATETSYRVERSGVGLSLRIRRGDRVVLNGADRYLTARWRMYSAWHGRALKIPVRHEPWALDSAELLDFADNGLLDELGLAPPSLPVVRCASRVDARFGLPTLM